MLRLSVERKLTRKMPNRLLTSSNMILLPVALCRLLTSASFATLLCYRCKLTCFMSSEKNRLQNCLTGSNIQSESVASDTFGKSAQAILDKPLENPTECFDLEPLAYRSLKKKLSELRNAINGYIIPEQASKLKLIKTHYESLESRKVKLEKLILSLPISRNLLFFKPTLVSSMILPPLESFLRSVPI